MQTLLLIVLFLTINAIVATSKNNKIVVTTTIGKIQGHYVTKKDDDDNNKIVEFLGIPYASPPVGKLRFKRTKQLRKLKKTFIANNFGPSCIQFPNNKKNKNTRQSEDCLTLNIFTNVQNINGNRDDDDDDKDDNSNNANGDVDNIHINVIGETPHLKPVIVQFHGGELTSGSSYDLKDESISLATNSNFIIVSLNYRLNVFGWLSIKPLSDESPRRISGNYGLHDCISALRFIKGNIKSFGGNPENIMIHGFNTGASIVYALLGSPFGKGLFNKAISINGAPRLNSTVREAEVFWHKDVVQNTKCGDNENATSKSIAKCLRELSTKELLNSMPSLLTRKNDKYSIDNIFHKHTQQPPLLLIDNYLLLSDYQTSFSNKRNTITSNYVPLILGYQTDTEVVNTSSVVDENFSAMQTDSFSKYLKKLTAKFGKKFSNEFADYYLSRSKLFNDLGNIIDRSNDNNAFDYIINDDSNLMKDNYDDVDDGEDMDDSSIKYPLLKNDELLNKIILDLKLVCPNILLARSLSLGWNAPFYMIQSSSTEKDKFRKIVHKFAMSKDGTEFSDELISFRNSNRMQHYYFDSYYINNLVSTTGSFVTTYQNYQKNICNLFQTQNLFATHGLSE
jgi:carboxylesterase type B